MSTVIRPEISKENPYYISKHRYYELKHFCLQYREWKKIYNSICEKIPGGIIRQNVLERPNRNDPNFEKRMHYYNLICLIEDSALLADRELGDYILLAVVDDRSYSWLRSVMRIPCCKDIYYEKYRKFFWILDKRRDAE